jgi:hypothetical protein
MTTNNQQSKTNDFAEFDFADDIQVKGDDAVAVEAKNVGAQDFEPVPKPVQKSASAVQAQNSVPAQNSPHVERIIAQQLSSQQASLSQKSKTATKGGQEKTDGWFKKIFAKKKVETKQSEKKPIAEIVRFAYEPEPEVVVGAQNLEPVQTQNKVGAQDFEPVQVQDFALGEKKNKLLNTSPSPSLKEGKIKEQEGKIEEVKPKISVPDQIVSVLSESFKKVEPKTLEILKKEEKGVEVKKIEPAQTKVVLPKQEVKSEIDGNREINRNKETEKLEIAKNKVDVKKGVEKIPSPKKKSGFFSGLFKKDLEKKDQPFKIGTVSSPKNPNLKISEIEKIKPEAQKEFSYAVSMDKLLAGYDGAQYFKAEQKEKIAPTQEIKSKISKVGTQNFEPLQMKDVEMVEKKNKLFYTSPNPSLKEGKTEEKSKVGKIKEETMEGKMEEELKEGKEKEEKKEFSYAVTMDKLLAGYDGAQYFKKEVESKKIHTTISKNQLLQQKPAVGVQKAVGAQDFEPVQTKDVSIVEKKNKLFYTSLYPGYTGASPSLKEGKTKEEKKIKAQNLEPLHLSVQAQKTASEENYPTTRKRVIQNREDESLVYDKKDAEELSEIKTVSGPIVFKEEKVEDFHIAELVRRLVKDIKIVNGLKINMIERLNMIIDSYLRDVRTGVETKFLLKKSVEEGGMGFSADQVDQIMSIVSATHKQIHLAKGASEIITSKTAKENQLGVFSESIKKPIILPSVNQNKVGVQNFEPVQAQSLVPVPTIKTTKKESWLKKLFGGKKKNEIDRNVGAQNLEPVQKLIQAKVVLPKQEIKSFYTSSTSTADLRPNPSLKEGNTRVGAQNLEPLQKQNFVPVEIKPNLAKLRSSIDINNNKPKMEDIKIVRPHLTGPIEELAEMTIMDFRRLAPTIEDISLKIIEKIGLINQESFSKHLAGINAWRASQPNQLYLKMGRDIIMNNQDIVELINKAKEEKKMVLSLSEFKMINQMNRGFRF